MCKKAAFCYLGEIFKFGRQVECVMSNVYFFMKGRIMKKLVANEAVCAGTCRVSEIVSGSFRGGEVEPGTFCDTECPQFELPQLSNEDEIFLVENGAGCRVGTSSEF